jgi:tetratricopeptide (TPR) repeat protein
MRRVVILGGLAVLVLLASACTPTQLIKMRTLIPPEIDIPAHIKNVAVLEFTGPRGGKTVAVKLEQELLNNGFYKVIERSQIAAIIAEKNFQETDLTENDDFMAQMKIMNVQALITGSVETFNARTDKGVDERKEQRYVTSHRVGTDKKGRPIMRPIYRTVTIKEPWTRREGNVNATFRMVDVGTGQLISSVSVAGAVSTGKVKGNAPLPTESQVKERAALGAVIKFIRKVSVWTEVRKIPLKRGAGCANGNNFAANELYPEAEQAFRGAAAIPGNYAAHYNLGLVLEAQGRFAEAEESFKQALLMRANDRDIMHALKRIRMKIQNEEFLRSLLEREKEEKQP